MCHCNKLWIYGQCDYVWYWKRARNCIEPILWNNIHYLHGTSNTIISRARAIGFCVWTFNVLSLLMMYASLCWTHSMENLLKRHCRQFCHFAIHTQIKHFSISIKMAKKIEIHISNELKFTIPMTYNWASHFHAFARISTSNSNKFSKKTRERKKHIIYESSEKPFPWLFI